MYSDIDILPAAKSDVLALRGANPKAWAAVVFFLEQARAEPQLVQKFASHGDAKIGSVDTNIVGWVEARHAGHNLIRVKFPPASAAAGYRIICGYDWHVRRVGVVAVVERGELGEYELDSSIAKRILRDWNFATDGKRTW